MNKLFGRLKKEFIYFCGFTAAYEGVVLMKRQALGIHDLKKSEYKTNLIRQTISEFGGDLSLKGVDIYVAPKGMLAASFSSPLSMRHYICISQTDIERLAINIKRDTEKNHPDENISEDQLVRAIVGHEATHMMEYHQYWAVMITGTCSRLLAGFVPYRAASLVFQLVAATLIYYPLQKQFEFRADTVASRINSDIRNGLRLCFTCLAEAEEEAFKVFELEKETNTEIIMDNIYEFFETHPTHRKRVENILHTL